MDSKNTKEIKDPRKINEVGLRIIGGLLAIIIAIMSYFGTETVSMLKENTRAVISLNLALAELRGVVDANRLKDTEQDEDIKENKGAIKENKKAVEDHDKRLIKLEVRK